MPRYYLIKSTPAFTSTASAESEQSAARLEARGYCRCTLGYWRAVRRVNEEAGYRQLAIEDARAKGAAPAETAPLGALVTIRS